MKTFFKFLALALIGFGLGAGLALFQKSRSAGDTVVTAPVQTPAAETETSAAETATESAETAAATEEADVAPAESTDSQIADPVEQEATAEALPADGADAAVSEETEAAASSEAAETVAEKAPEKAAGQFEAAVAGSPVGGAFTLTDHEGMEVTEKSWPGKKKLVFFGFAHCPDICPAALDKITAALETLGDDAAQVQPLFITIDPYRDTPAFLKQYLTDYHPAIVGLTGTEEQIRAVKNSYKVYAARVEGASPDSYSMDHSGYIYLMSEDDGLLQLFRSSDTADVLVEKIRQHL